MCPFGLTYNLKIMRKLLGVQCVFCPLSSLMAHQLSGQLLDNHRTSVDVGEPVLISHIRFAL